MRIFKNFWATASVAPKMHFPTYVHLHSLALVSAYRVATKEESAYFHQEKQVVVQIGEYVVRTVGDYAVVDTRTFAESYAPVTAELMNALFSPDYAIM